MRKSKYAMLFISIPLIIFSISKIKRKISSVDSHLSKPEPPFLESSSVSTSDLPKNIENGSRPHFKTLSPIDDQLIPWKEIDRKWMEALEDHLLSYENGRRMFLKFKVEKEKFHRTATLLNERRSKMTDKHFNRQFQVAHKLLLERTKKCFGKYYPEVKQFYKDYEISIQAYSREFPIGLDYAFNEL